MYCRNVARPGEREKIPDLSKESSSAFSSRKSFAIGILRRQHAFQARGPVGEYIRSRVFSCSSVDGVIVRPPLFPPRCKLSSPGESHPEALPELYVSVSTHTAPVVNKPTTLVLPERKQVRLTINDLQQPGPGPTPVIA